jgi:hypothetical protein
VKNNIVQLVRNIAHIFSSASNWAILTIFFAVLVSLYFQQQQNIYVDNFLMYKTLLQSGRGAAQGSTITVRHKTLMARMLGPSIMQIINGKKAIGPSVMPVSRLTWSIFYRLLY